MKRKMYCVAFICIVGVIYILWDYASVLHQSIVVHDVVVETDSTGTYRRVFSADNSLYSLCSKFGVEDDVNVSYHDTIYTSGDTKLTECLYQGKSLIISLRLAYRGNRRAIVGFTTNDVGRHATMDADAWWMRHSPSICDYVFSFF